MYVLITLQSRTLYHTGSEKDKLKLLISSAEDWLYGDGFDSTKQQYGKYALDMLGITLVNVYGTIELKMEGQTY